MGISTLKGLSSDDPEERPTKWLLAFTPPINTVLADLANDLGTSSTYTFLNVSGGIPCVRSLCLLEMLSPLSSYLITRSPGSRLPLSHWFLYRRFLGCSSPHNVEFRTTFLSCYVHTLYIWIRVKKGDSNQTLSFFFHLFVLADHVQTCGILVSWLGQTPSPLH